MITRLDRYVFKVVLSTSLVALLVLLVLETFFTLLIELEDLGKGNYGLAEILQFLLLTLPQRTYEIFPMALLLGGLLGMGTLADGSELIAMRAAGLSILRLIGAVLQGGLVLTLLALLLGEFVAPDSERLAQKLRSAATSEAVSIRAGKGFWARDGNYFINVRGVLPGLRLTQVYIYEIGEHAELKSVTAAAGARYANDRWVLQGVVHSDIKPERVTAGSLPELAMSSAIQPDILEVLALDPQDLAIRELHAYIQYLKHNGLDTRTYELAFWTKMIAPLSNLVMLFIAMPFVFGSQRSTGMGQRLVIGVFLGLLFYLGNRMLGNVVLLYGYPPLLGAALPTLVFFTGGSYLLKRMR